MSQYMRNMFPYNWIASPLRKEIEKTRLKWLTITSWKELQLLAEAVRALDQREYQYVAITLLQKHKKLWTPESIKFFEKLIKSKSWWDTVDSIDTNLIWQYFMIYPKEKERYALKRAASSNIWLQRTAIQFQLLYKDQTDTKLLEKIFEHTKWSKEFFVQKGMWWMLRQHSKIDPKRVKAYISKNKLAPLTIREWSKYI